MGQGRRSSLPPLAPTRGHRATSVRSSYRLPDRPCAGRRPAAGSATGSTSRAIGRPARGRPGRRPPRATGRDPARTPRATTDPRRPKSAVPARTTRSPRPASTAARRRPAPPGGGARGQSTAARRSARIASPARTTSASAVMVAVAQGPFSRPPAAARRAAVSATSPSRRSSQRGSGAGPTGRPGQPDVRAIARRQHASAPGRRRGTAPTEPGSRSWRRRARPLWSVRGRARACWRAQVDRQHRTGRRDRAAELLVHPGPVAVVRCRSRVKVGQPGGGQAPDDGIDGGSFLGHEQHALAARGQPC